MAESERVADLEIDRRKNQAVVASTSATCQEQRPTCASSSGFSIGGHDGRSIGFV